MIYGYIRVSTVMQDIETQRLQILKYGQANKIHIDQFVEVELSSRKTLRQRKIEQLLELTRPGDTIICVELSRLGRSMSELFDTVEKFEKKGVDLIFIRQPELSTGQSPIKKLMLAILGYFAETERDLISERTKSGLERARMAGHKLGRPKGSKQKDHPLNRHIPEIQSLLRKNVGIASIAKILNVNSGTLNYFLKSRDLR